MTWFLKTNKNKSGVGKPQWEDVTINNPFNMCIGVWLAFLFAFLLMIVPPLYFLPIIVYHYVLFSTIFYKGFLNGKQVTSFNIIIETLKYYKITIVSTLSLFIILQAFSKLGRVAGVTSIIILCLVYFGVISIDLFNSVPEKNLTPVGKYDQAKKTCSTKISAKENGFFNFFGQKGGNKIANELKRLGKTLA